MDRIGAGCSGPDGNVAAWLKGKGEDRSRTEGTRWDWIGAQRLNGTGDHANGPDWSPEGRNPMAGAEGLGRHRIGYDWTGSGSAEAD